MNRGTVTDAEASQDGFSLIEVLIAVAILGLGFTALLGALGVAFSGSNSYRGQSDAKTVVISAAERVKQAAYVDCATASSYVNAARLVGTDFPSSWGSQAQAQSRINVIEVRYWDGTSFVSACSDTASTYLKVQQITVTATSPNDRATERITVVKRGPS